jgi:hypothetical protein
VRDRRTFFIAESCVQLPIAKTKSELGILPTTVQIVATESEHSVVGTRLPAILGFVI